MACASASFFALNAAIAASVSAFASSCSTVMPSCFSMKAISFFAQPFFVLASHVGLLSLAWVAWHWIFG